MKKLMPLIVVLALVAAFFTTKIVGTNIAKKTIDEGIAEASMFADITYGKVDVNPITRKTVIKDVTIAQKMGGSTTKVNEVIIYKVKEEDSITTELSLAMNGIEVSLKDLAKSNKELMELGYDDKILINAALDYEYSPKREEFAINKLSYGAKDFGELEMSLALSNIKLDTENPFSLMMTYPQILVNDAKIEYKDDSFVSRFTKVSAGKAGVKEDEFIAEITKTLDESIAKEENEMVKDALGEVKKFIENPKSISITASPESPAALGSVIDATNPYKAISVLNVKCKS